MSTTYQQIVDKVEARMKTILILNGYLTNTGLNVYISRNVPIGPKVQYGLNIKDGPETIDDKGVSGPNGVWNRAMTLKLVFEAAESTTTDTLLRNAWTDALKAIGTDPTWSGLAILTRAVPGEPADDQDEREIMSETMELQIEFRTERWTE